MSIPMKTRSGDELLAAHVLSVRLCARALFPGPVRLARLCVQVQQQYGLEHAWSQHGLR